MPKQSIKYARQRARQFHSQRVYWYAVARTGLGLRVTKRAGSYIVGGN